MQQPIFFQRSFISLDSFGDTRTVSDWPSDSDQPASSPAVPRGLVIYAVDDIRDLTELYAAILQAAAHTVMVFNDRKKALEALKSGGRKPDLLITDLLGGSMPADRFIDHCRVLHPPLRILMATGFDQPESLISRAWPDRFIRKPFTVEELQKKVRSALAA
jgi:DNA-binding NtrC family response regulator